MAQRTVAITIPLGILAILLATNACVPDGARRDADLSAIARWQERRLAPQDSLTTLLASPDAHVRLAAVRAAGLIGRNDIVDELLARLKDASPSVRSEACFALGILGDTLAVPALEAVSRDGKPALRLAALRGLAQVPNRGAALFDAAATGDPDAAAAAWDALRNQVDLVPRSALLRALQAGLTAAEPEVLWRVLRCAERLPDSTLTTLVAPHARSRRDQVRVHAYRALARLGGNDAFAAVLSTCDDHAFSGREAHRVAVAACRALGALAPAADDDALPGVTAYLIAQAGAAHPHPAQAALEAMAALVADRPLPAEAERQESLLAVWRIRLARAARSHLDHPDAGPRAAAAAAWAALRGRGGLGELVARLDVEAAPHVQAALLAAAIGIAPDPLRYLADPGAAVPARDHRNQAVDAAMIDALVARAADLDRGSSDGFLVSYAMLREPVPAITAVGHLGSFPSDLTAAALLGVARRSDGGPWHGDMMLAVLGSMTRMWTAADSLWTGAESLADEAAALLRRAFDDPDLRIRLEARRAALATDLLPADLIPGEASLRATLPAVVRDPAQPQVATSFKAPKVRGTTSRGGFEITLRADMAPNTCAMFLDLVRRGFYAGLTFHRVVPDFVVQGGDPTGTGWGGPGYTIRSEWSALPYARGAVGIAHSGKDTGGCQWFVTLSEQPHLVGRYTVFGEVTRGLTVFDAMQPGDTFDLEVVE